MEFEKWLSAAPKRLLPYHRDSKICVVSVIGKSPFSPSCNKAEILNTLCDTEAFSSLFFGTEQETEEVPSCQIQCHFDAKSGTVFLHLSSCYDIHYLNTKFSSVLQNDLNLFEFWESKEASFARYCLFLFAISHIIVVVQPNCIFDISYVRFFRSLDSLRLKLQPSVSDRLRTLSSSIPRAWVANGRPCSPRLLFCMHRPPVRFDPDKRINPIRRLEENIESQIYHVLRKSRVVTNNSLHSLCAVPLNEAFVYVVSAEEEPQDQVAWLLNYMNNFPEDSAYASDTEDEDSANNLSGFYSFLMQHIDLAHTKGFDDNVGRNPVPSFFELPRLRTFVKIAEEMFDFFIRAPPKADFDGISDYFRTELNFSENRCAKVLPMALSSYQDGLPPYYTTEQHEAKLAQALQVLSMQARGPGVEACSRKLIIDCEAYWNNGRQACEVLSLTANHCLNKLHVTEPDSSIDLPVMPHSSKFRFLSTCNCGHRQTIREDPFELKAANHDFYEDTEEFGCCRSLTRVPLPIFKPSTEDVKAANLLLEKLKLTTQSQEDTSRGSLGHTGSNEFLPDTDNKHLVAPEREGLSAHVSGGTHDSQLSPTDVLDSELDTIAPRADSALAAELKPEVKTQEDEAQTGPPSDSLSLDSAGDGASDEAESELKPEDSELIGIGVLPPTPKPEGVENQASTVEYLPGMLQLHSPPGLLPRFPSWTVLCLGSSSIYSHAHGLREQPNFSHGSGYLLPWDVSVRVDPERWQHRMEAMLQRRIGSGPPKRPKNPRRGDSSVSVKLFIGFEYECPRGHRFMLQSPSKMLKHSGPGGPKDYEATFTWSVDACPCGYPQSPRSGHPESSSPALASSFRHLLYRNPKSASIGPGPVLDATAALDLYERFWAHLLTQRRLRTLWEISQGSHWGRSKLLMLQAKNGIDFEAYPALWDDENSYTMLAIPSTDFVKQETEIAD